MIRVMIVDDQPMIRMGLRTMLEAHQDIEVCAEAGDGLAALAELAELAELEQSRPDVVLMDIRMPGIDGVETTRRIRAAHSPESLRIVVLTTFDHDANVLAALRAGANGFLSKGVGPTELTDAVLEVAAGGGALTPAAAAALIGHVADATEAPPDEEAQALFAGLTPREREVVEAIVSGQDNAEIARRMYVSPYTVKTHANRAMSKVGVRDRAQLVSLAVRAGFRP
ncbi:MULTISPECIES: response regulator [unclassified Streptomyces]|uniref:response regulator n=1 Tax=unclassified Streptomyces TaxID=2593676 RepID=UPI0036E22267